MILIQATFIGAVIGAFLFAGIAAYAMLIFTSRSWGRGNAPNWPIIIVAAVISGGVGGSVGAIVGFIVGLIIQVFS